MVTPAQRAYLEALGYRPGEIVETETDAERAQREMVQVGMAQWKAQRIAKAGHAVHREALRRDGDPQGHPRRLLHELCRYVAERRGEVLGGDRRVHGTPTTGELHGLEPEREPTRAGEPGRRRVRLRHGRVPGDVRADLHRRRRHVRERLPDGDVADVDDGVYLYHRLLIKLATAANNGTIMLPIRVKVNSQYSCCATRDATQYVGTRPPFPGGFQHDFFSRYQTPEDGKAWIEQLAARAARASRTSSSRRSRRTATCGPAQASIGCSVPTIGGNSSIGARSAVGGTPANWSIAGTPATCSTAQQAAAVMLESKAMGNQYLGDPNAPGPSRHDIGNQITYQVVDPSPLRRACRSRSA